MLNGEKVLAVLPARLNSTRLPRKPLINIKGKPLIYYTYKNLGSSLIDKKIVASDSPLVIDTVKSFGGEALLTSPTHANGSERVAEVVKQFPDYSIVLNIQGDEPMVSGSVIKKLLSPFKKPEVSMSTLKVKISAVEAKKPNVVKVVTNDNDEAIYFSRAPIPYSSHNVSDKTKVRYFKHVGVYAFRREYLLKYISKPESELEKIEGLEQLRVIEAGESIYVAEIKEDLIDINLKSDIRKFKEKLEQGSINQRNIINKGER